MERAARRGADGTRGRLLLRRIPGTVSHFRARRALIYLPPAAQRQSAARLPLLLLLHGTPGGPADWAVEGGLLATLNDFAAHHGGRSPVVVMPDINGATRADSECVATDRGNVEQYLTVDVPRYVVDHFAVATSPRDWGIAGLSEGGMCSLMLTLRHSSTFTTAGDFSGLARPTVGRVDDPTATIRELFHGSVAAYDEHDPLWLMSRHRYPELAVWFECGRRDAKVVRAQQQVAALARRAGMDVQALVVAGAHSWALWRRTLPAALPWLWQRMTR